MGERISPTECTSGRRPQWLTTPSTSQWPYSSVYEPGERCTGNLSREVERRLHLCSNCDNSCFVFPHSLIFQISPSHHQKHSWMTTVKKENWEGKANLYWLGGGFWVTWAPCEKRQRGREKYPPSRALTSPLSAENTTFPECSYYQILILSSQQLSANIIIKHDLWSFQGFW